MYTIIIIVINRINYFISFIISLSLVFSLLHLVLSK